MERAFDFGALDCWFTPIQMKKNRPATMISILCDDEKKEDLLGLLYTETSTLGVRVSNVERNCLEREIRKVETVYGEIDVKLAKYKNKIVNAKPEYDQMREFALQSKKSLREIEREILEKINNIIEKIIKTFRVFHVFRRQKILTKKQKNKIDLEKIAAGVRMMLEGMGEDPERDGLQKTPERVASFYAELTEGMWQDARAEIVPLPGDSHDEMVIVKDISIASVCEHHLAPFVGKSSHRIYSEKRAHHRFVEIGTHRRNFRQAFASSGTSDTGNRADAF